MAAFRSPSGSSTPEVKSYGITKPISVAEPTEADFQRNTELEKVNSTIFFVISQKVGFISIFLLIFLSRFYCDYIGSFWLIRVCMLAKKRMLREKRLLATWIRYLLSLLVSLCAYLLQALYFVDKSI